MNWKDAIKVACNGYRAIFILFSTNNSSIWFVIIWSSWLFFTLFSVKNWTISSPIVSYCCNCSNVLGSKICKQSVTSEKIIKKTTCLLCVWNRKKHIHYNILIIVRNIQYNSMLSQRSFSVRVFSIIDFKTIKIATCASKQPQPQNCLVFLL